MTNKFFIVTRKIPTYIKYLIAKKSQGSKLPEGYLQLNYIESTGPQWIDTEISGDCDIDITCQGTLDSNRSQIVVGRYTLGGNYFGQVTTTHKWGMGIASTGGLTDILYLDKERFLLSFRQNESIINVKGKTYRVEIDNFYNYTYALCRSKEKSGNAYYASSVRIFACRIRQNGNLVRDYIPAKKISTGEIGLYDTVTQTLYVSLGTDPFIEG
jgi:hypothetical protein